MADNAKITLKCEKIRAISQHICGRGSLEAVQLIGGKATFAKLTKLFGDSVTLQGFFHWAAALEEGRLVRPRLHGYGGGVGGAARPPMTSDGGAAAGRPKLVVRDGWLLREDEQGAAREPEAGEVMSRQMLLHQ